VILELDIAAEQAVLVAEIQEAIGVFGGMDVLVNNAGYVSVGTLEDLEYGQPITSAILFSAILTSQHDSLTG
jgi:NAD(P)-dependent dehydrogenase (short-subunit alcohol dehydrogenase family)